MFGDLWKLLVPQMQHLIPSNFNQTLLCIGCLFKKCIDFMLKQHKLVSAA